MRSGVDKRTVARTVYHALLGLGELSSIRTRSERGGYDLVPANRDLAGAEVELVELPARETRLKSALERIAGDYDYILIDCPPSLGLLTVNAMAAADGLLIPVQCEYFALEGVSQMVETLQRIQAALNPALVIDGVLLTMYDGRANLSRQVVHELREYFKDRVYKAVVPRNVRLGEAPSFGRPIMLYDIRSRGADAYMNLAREVIRSYEKTSTRERTQQPHP